ncbi:MAG TPA: antibiotic biosynthesis monooxygenase [Polyangia bacterium]
MSDKDASSLLVVHVHCHVREDFVDAFREASVANARASVQEPGVARFDVIADREDPCHFVLLEVYRSPEAPAAHKETAHYQTWRDTVAPMMAEPRTSRKYTNVFPTNGGW